MVAYPGPGLGELCRFLSSVDSGVSWEMKLVRVA